MLTQVNERTYELRHERLESYLEIWQPSVAGSPGAGKWYWHWVAPHPSGGKTTGGIKGSEPQVFVAIEKAMVELEKRAAS